MKKHVFISYSRKDKDFAEELIKQIEAADIDSWIDAQQLRGSRNWPEEIRKAIDTAYALIVIKSPSSQRSKYVTSEWSYARGAGVPIVPILCRPQKTTNAMLEDIHHLDFTDPTTRPWQELFQLLNEKRNEFGVRVRIPKDAPPKVRSGLEKLNSDIPEDVVYGANLLGNLRDPIAVPGLIITLGHDNDEVMRAALQALTNIGDVAVPQLIDEFLKNYDNENTPLRIAIVLGEIESEAALSGLLDATYDSRDRVRYFAVHGLNRMKRIEAVPRLLQLLRDSDHIVRSESASALIESGDRTTVPALMEALRDTDKEVRSAAARGLGKRGNTSALESLLNALHDPELSVRVSAAYALGRIGDPKAIDELFRLSEDSIAAVRQVALDALNYIRTPEAMDAIKRWPSQPRNTSEQAQ